MICTLDVAIQAANPTMPLAVWKSFVGSPTSVRVRNVPRKIGAWELTAVHVVVNYPDNTIKTTEAVLTSGVWVATIPACEVVGESATGYKIEADGKDERGEVVTGYVLGTGDVKIYDIDSTITPGETTYYIHIVDEKPKTPHKGDFALDTMEIFDGEAWRSFSAPADYAAVRAAAMKGAAHADERGNPHGTTFASLPDKPTIPEEVTEATVEGWGFLKKTWQSLVEFFAVKSHKHEIGDINASVFPPETVSDLNTRPETRGKSADAQDVFDKLAEKVSGDDNISLLDNGDGIAVDVLQDGDIKHLYLPLVDDYEFVALASQLGFTSQDITDLLHFKGDWEYREWGEDAYRMDDVVLKDNRFYRCTDAGAAEDFYEGAWTLIYAKNEGKTGLERLIDLFGESNSQLAKTIRDKVLADGEGEIKDSLFKDEAFGGGSSSAPEGSLSKTVADIKASARPNITVVGSPTINGGSVSGFSAANYLVFPSTVDIGNATVDFDLTVQTGSQVATQENILDSWCGLALAIENGQWVLAVSTDGITFANVGRGGTVAANTPYRLRISFSHTLDGGHLVTLRESDGEGGYGEPIISMTLAAHIFPKPLYFGGANPVSGMHHIFTGVINIGACSMTFNGTQVWNGWFGVVPPHKHKAEDITDFAEAVRALFGNAETTEYGTEA